MLPNDEIHRVHYFTAMVSETPWNAGAPLRQEIYIRALRTRALVYVHLGKFQPIFRTGTPAFLTPGMPSNPITIETWEEKGSDVNLAARLLMDAVAEDFEQALVVSNDSDLTEPIRAIKQHFNLPIVDVSPYDTVTNKLRKAASSRAILDKSLLASCQLPITLKDKKGRMISKPDAW
jgi:hypothetical protein